MNIDTAEGGELHSGETAEEEIARRDTGVRILLTLLFAVIWGVLETVLAAVVVFGLIWALLTEQAPPPRVREFANRLVSYGYRMWRYITHNEARVPFPFSEFPEAVEPPGDLGRDEAEQVRELLDRPLHRDRDIDLD